MSLPMPVSSLGQRCEGQVLGRVDGGSRRSSAARSFRTEPRSGAVSVPQAVT